MELFLAQNHSAMTHLPTASAILGALAALAVLFAPRKDIAWSWALLSIVAFVTAVPAIATGIAAAKGRFNDDGKPYLQSGVIVPDTPQNARIHQHQLLAATGTALAVLQAIFAVALLRGRKPNKYFIAFLAVLLAIFWGIGGHVGGRELWGPDTFPAFH